MNSKSLIIAECRVSYVYAYINDTLSRAIVFMFGPKLHVFLFNQLPNWISGTIAIPRTEFRLTNFLHDRNPGRPGLGMHYPIVELHAGPKTT